MCEDVWIPACRSLSRLHLFMSNWFILWCIESHDGPKPARADCLFTSLFCAYFQLIVSHGEVLPCRERGVPEGCWEMQEEVESAHRWEELCSNYASSCVSSLCDCNLFLSFCSGCGYKSNLNNLFVVCFCRWHSAGTFDVSTKTGGPFGTMRLQEELGHGANNGLDIAIRLLEPIREQFPILSYADFHQVYSLTSTPVHFFLFLVVIFFFYF